MRSKSAKTSLTIHFVFGDTNCINFEKSSLMKFIYSLLILLLFSSESLAQNDPFYMDAGISVQQYPTGFLLGGKAEVGIAKRHAIDVRFGYNLLDHRGFGVHDEEKGGGFSFTPGYKFYFKQSNTRFFLGARTDVWFNSVNWKDFVNGNLNASGTTDIVVLQPTVIAGYNAKLPKNWLIAPTLAVGAEFNVITKGAPVGEGLILLWGIDIHHRFFNK